MAISTHDFDQMINRRGTQSVKHDFMPEDVISMWVADMDFRSPEPVIQALQERAAHGVFGYTMESESFKQVIVERMARLYNWTVQPGEIIALPGVVAAFTLAMRVFGGTNVMTTTPVYPPFLSAPNANGQALNAVPMAVTRQGQRLHYEMNFDAMEAAVDDGTRVFILCSPHNPVGRVWTREELTQLAEFCAKHELVLISDEIHADFVFSGYQHIPTASLAPEVASRTITLMAPSKTFNIPSLGFAFAIIQDEALRTQFGQAVWSQLPHPGCFGLTAAHAAYSEGQPWLDDLMVYLQANRDLTTAFLEANLPEVPFTHPEGTYLTWLDCRAYELEQVAPAGNDFFSQVIEPFFMQKAKVALNSGLGFAAPGFARLNFGTPRARLQEALERMQTAIMSK
ncbi:MAG: PatB family C-S lyase [Anaerolineae bacterium]